MSIDLFQKINKNINYPELIFLLNKSIQKSFKNTIILAFYIRDIKGLGKREIGRSILQFLLINYPKKFKRLIPLIPIYGRWDDLLYLFPNSTKLDNLSFTNLNYCSKIKVDTYNEAKICQNYIVKFFCNTMLRDRYNMLENKNITLLGKWAPTEYSSKDSKYNLVNTICKFCNITPRNYRKKYITPLRKTLDITERHMCKKEWDKIDYSKVPNATKNKFYKAFMRNDRKRFSKRNREYIYSDNPSYYIRKYSYTLNIRPEIEKLWKKHLKKYTNNFDKIRACIDTSSQMYSRKKNGKYMFNKFFLDIAISTALVLSHKTNIVSNFNKIITFEESDSLISKIIKINKLCIPSTNNIHSILSNFENYTTIIITTQTLNLNQYNNQKIIYWLISDEPIDIEINNNLIIVKGYNDIIVKTLLKTCDITYKKIIDQILLDKRYNMVKNKFLK